MVTTKLTAKRTIIREGEPYVYIGDIPNTVRTKTEYLKNECGRKTVFKKGIDGWLNVYISKKFYPKLCNTTHPYHGTETLK